MIGALAAAVMLTAGIAEAQPWRYVKNGAVHYTSNVDELPPKMKARILAQRAAEDAAKEKTAEAAEASESASTAAPPQVPAVPSFPRPERIKGHPARAAGSPMPRDVGQRPAPPPKPAEATPKAPSVAERRAELQAELTAARAALVEARRQALLVPDGRTYAARTAAEQRVAELEAALRALGE